MQNNLNINKERDFISLFSDPFSYFVKEFRTLAKAVLLYAGPIYLLQIILTSFIVDVSDPMSFLQAGKLPEITGNMFGIYLVQIFAYVMLVTVVISYMKLRNSIQDREIELSEIWEQISKYYWKIFGSQLVYGLIIGLSAGIGIAIFAIFASKMLIIITLATIVFAVYMAITLSFMNTGIILEDKNISETIKRSLFIIKGKWWFFFIVLILFSLILGIVGSIFSLPMLLTSMSGLSNNGILFLLTLFQTLGSIILGILPVILTVYAFGTFREEKEQTSLIEKIENINSDIDELNKFDY